jgi:hypothetical protein
MPKATTAERLGQALTRIKNRVEDHIKKIAASNIRNAFCVIAPTHAKAPQLTHEQLEAIKEDVLARFKDEHLFGLAIRYFRPSFLPALKPKDIADHDIRVGIAEFDEGWQIDEYAKGMLYCPSDGELGRWHSRYERQTEGLRLTPLLERMFCDMQARECIRHFLSQPAHDFFVTFAKKHALTDDAIPSKDRLLDIKDLYHESRTFPEEGAPIFYAYSEAGKIASKTQNSKTRCLMRGFQEAVEQRCLKLLEDMNAPQSTREEIFHDLRRGSLKPDRVNDAERPAQGLDYFRMAQLLMLFILEFLEDPKKHPASGEIAIFIWLCQHIAFEKSHLGVKITDLLNLKSGDFDPLKKCIRIKDHMIQLTEGLIEIFIAWLGKKKRVNDRLLFTALSYDFLAANLTRVSVKLPSFTRDLLPKDLLIAPHAMGYDAKVGKSVRQHLDWQCAFVSKSPFANSSDLTKQIREAIAATLSKSSH